MQIALPIKKSARFPLGIFGLTTFALLATFAIVGGLIYLSAQKSDEQALQSQTTLVAHAISEARKDFVSDQEDVVSWDSAVRAVTDHVNIGWLSENLGHEMYDLYDNELVFILRPNLSPIYAMNRGIDVHTTTFQKYRIILEPLARDLQKLDKTGDLTNYTQGRLEQIPHISDIALIGGRPALISAMPIASNSTNHPMRPGTEYIHITTKFLDDDMAVHLGQLLLLTQPQFDLRPPTQKDRAYVPIVNRAGQAVAYYSWLPPRPGTVILSSIAPVVSAAFLFVTLIVSALLARLYRSTRQIEEGRRAAEHMAFHDPLTGLANRSLFEISLEKALVNGRKNDSRMALLMIDLDRFKQVNDTLGHDAGDQLIKQVPERLERLVSKPHTIARLGGDEFAMVIEQIDGSDEVLELAAAVIRVLQRPFQIANSQAYIGASIGVCVAPDMAQEGSELVRKADIALYEAKAGGRNCAMLFEESMAQTVQRRLVIEERLRNALSSGKGIAVDYLPYLDKTGTEIAGVEASLAWSDSELGDVPASEFMPVAEGTGLIQMMGMHVLRQACRYGADNPHLRVSVRACGTQISDPGFPEKIMAVVQSTGMTPQRLDMEVDQEALLDENPSKLANLAALKAAGVNVTLAQFGSSLQSIYKLIAAGVTRIKLNGNFVANLASASDPRSMAKSMEWLVRAMGVEVTADSVDTPEQKALLDQIGCTAYRGRLFSPQGQAAWLRTATEFQNQQARRQAVHENEPEARVNWT